MPITALAPALALVFRLSVAPSPEPLLNRMATDWAAGRPLVAEVHVALCDNAFVRCGGRGRGDGDDLARNLYWATSGGFDGWFGRRGSPWHRVATLPPAGNVLTTVVWKRRQAPPPWLKARGVRHFGDVYVIAHAWRGRAIDAAVDAWVADLWGAPEAMGRTLSLLDGTALASGAAAHVVAYVGHNRLMDRRTPYPFPREQAGPPKGAIAMACHTASYLGHALHSPKRVPLLLTHDFVFAGASAFEGALEGFVQGGDLATGRARPPQPTPRAKASLQVAWPASSGSAPDVDAGHGRPVAAGTAGYLPPDEATSVLSGVVGQFVRAPADPPTRRPVRSREIPAILVGPPLAERGPVGGT